MTYPPFVEQVNAMMPCYRSKIAERNAGATACTWGIVFLVHSGLNQWKEGDDMDEEIVLTPEQEEELSENKGGPENMPEVTIIAEGGPDDA